MTEPMTSISWFEDLSIEAIRQVGGKNASLGEMIQRLKTAGVQVPAGFATTVQVYHTFLEANQLQDPIRALLEALQHQEKSLAETGQGLRELILKARFPDESANAIRTAYRELSQRYGSEAVDVAVRSSATAEDLPEASFAGQQETFLNICGADALLKACQRCFASLFTDRALSYRENHGIDHLQVALSVGVQKMVRSDQGSAGVMFSLDPETGFPQAVLLSAAWGLGESVVQGRVDPDQYLVFKPLLDQERYRPILAKTRGSKASRLIYADQGDEPVRTVATSEDERTAWVLSEEEILTLARWAVAIERHYQQPMDMEWAKDGESGELFMVQARPETVQSQQARGVLKAYSLKAKGHALLSGDAIGEAIASGPVCKLGSASERDRFPDGGILVTAMTDPDWVPLMKRAAALVTDHGGRTSHAAIVSRELGLPAIVGTGQATQILTDGQEVTVSCAEGDRGVVYEGRLDYEVQDVPLEDLPQTRTQIMLNLADPATALRWWRLPSDGVGLARLEFIINNLITVHPLALVRWDSLEDQEARRQIAEITQGWADKPQYFVDTLAAGIARIAAVHYPHPAIVRMSDFKTNEYAQLLGGRAFEPTEENPMLGWRGASRYYSAEYREGFALECRALKKVREEIGLDNVILMIPFCRTLAEADRVLAVLADNGLKRGENGLEIYVMCELPANVVLARQFAERFDGFSIGSNDLTQLVLGVERDSARLADLFDEQNEAVTELIAAVIRTAHEAGRKVGLCGQAPSDHPEFARFLVQAGIDSISVNPDRFLAVKRHVAEAEQA